MSNISMREANHLTILTKVCTPNHGAHSPNLVDQHKQIVAFDFGGMPRQDKKSPQIYGSAWIAPTATLTGRVLVSASLYFVTCT